MEQPQKALRHFHGALKDNLNVFPVRMWSLALKVLLPKRRACHLVLTVWRGWKRSVLLPKE